MTDDDQRAARTYRYRPWLALTVVVSLILLSIIGVVLVHAATHPSYQSMMAVLVALVSFGGLEAFVLLSWRIRTVVDDAGVTQCWILRRYRIQWSEVTALELVQSPHSWHVRVQCGERTFETIQCLRLFVFAWPETLRALVGSPGGVPRAARLAHEDMRLRWKAHHCRR